jgi:hypothetical protein
MKVGLNVQMLDRLIRELQQTHDANFPLTPMIEDPREVLLTDHWPKMSQPAEFGTRRTAGWLLPRNEAFRS